MFELYSGDSSGVNKFKIELLMTLAAEALSEQ